MTEVVVCVGSSCHIKGSYQVIATFKELIKEHHLEEQVCLKASFCMERCMSGISMTINGQPIQGVGFANSADIFYTRLLPMLSVPEEGCTR